MSHLDSKMSAGMQDLDAGSDRLDVGMQLAQCSKAAFYEWLILPLCRERDA